MENMFKQKKCQNVSKHQSAIFIPSLTTPQLNVKHTLFHHPTTVPRLAVPVTGNGVTAQRVEGGLQDWQEQVRTVVESD